MRAGKGRLRRTELGFATMELSLPTERGVYSAEEFERREPGKFSLCVRALALGYKLDQIRKALGVAWETVRAVRDRKGETIREQKKRLGDLCFGIAERGLEEMLQDDKRMARLDAVQLAILIDKGLLLAGEATSILEKREGAPALESLLQTIRDVTGGAPGVGLREEGFALGGGVGGGPVIEVEPVELGVARDGECADLTSQPAGGGAL